MKKLRITLILLTLVAASSWIAGVSNFVIATEPNYSDEYQQVLEYRVTDWNGTNAVEWYVWANSTNGGPIHRGFIGSQIDGKIVVNISETHNKTSRLSYVANPDPVPYGDISFYWQNGDLNFTATNISSTEMAYVLNLGYMNWFPGFVVPIDWDENAAVALAQSDVWGILCDVSVINQTNSVVYSFRQRSGSILQTTTLKYDTTTGTLIYGFTQFGNYWCKIIPYGPKYIPQPQPTIPGYSLITIGAIMVTMIFGIALGIKKKTTQNK
ncbi:MAG: hypothetical protein ACTSRE_11725 [Promethearchaeota archaeon]